MGDNNLESYAHQIAKVVVSKCNSLSGVSNNGQQKVKVKFKKPILEQAISKNLKIKGCRIPDIIAEFDNENAQYKEKRIAIEIVYSSEPSSKKLKDLIEFGFVIATIYIPTFEGIREKSPVPSNEMQQMAAREYFSLLESDSLKIEFLGLGSEYSFDKKWMFKIAQKDKENEKNIVKALPRDITFKSKDVNTELDHDLKELGQPIFWKHYEDKLIRPAVQKGKSNYQNKKIEKQVISTNLRSDTKNLPDLNVGCSNKSIDIYPSKPTVRKHVKLPLFHKIGLLFKSMILLFLN